MSLVRKGSRAYIGRMTPNELSAILPFQIASGILLGAMVIMVISKGMNIHRANDGWRSWFGALWFVFGFLLAGIIIIFGSLAPLG